MRRGVPQRLRRDILFAVAESIGVGLRPDQFVAWQLQKIRRERGLTQEQAGARVATLTGNDAWRNKANFSFAERSVDGNRIRQFTTDELIAFAKVFDVPVSYFFEDDKPREPRVGLCRFERPRIAA